jgi:hypothetical protein
VKPLPVLGPEALLQQFVVQPSPTPQTVLVEYPDLSDAPLLDVDQVNSPARGVFISSGVTILALCVLIFAAWQRKR